MRAFFCGLASVLLLVSCTGQVGGASGLGTEGIPSPSSPDGGTPGSGLPGGTVTPSGGTDAGTHNGGQSDGGSSDAGTLPPGTRSFSTDRTQFFGSSRCAQSGLLLCDDFESGTLDRNTWQVN